MLVWIYLGIVVLLEVLAAVLTRLFVDKYPFLFYGAILPTLSLGRLILFSQVIRAGSGVDLSVAYSIRYGLSIALVAVAGVLLFKEEITVFKIVCILMVVFGLIGLNFQGSKV
jgi:multidrug transporter EmrE-like cation transporter